MKAAVTYLLALLLTSPCLAQTPEPIKKVAPQYPIRAMDRGQEGWVEVSFQIGADGAVIAPKVAAAMPEDVFDKAALAAVGKWQYAPADVGRPLAQVVVVAFSLLTTGTARAPVIDLLNDAAKAIQEGRADDAAKMLKTVANDDGLTLTELVFLERVRGLSDYRAGRFGEAARHFNRMLEIFGPRMTPEAVAGVVQMLVTAHLNSGAFPAAIAAVDRWLPPGQSLDPQIIATLAAIRQALADGRPIRLAPSP